MNLISTLMGQPLRQTTLVVVSVALALIPTFGVAQIDGGSAMREGNTLFRSGDYHSAIEKYQDALGAGFDTPLLRYNLGVAEYRRGDYVAAELNLRRATADSNLAALAYYNLGLTARATGRNAEAQRSFQRALSLSENSQLSIMATRALEAMQITPITPARTSSSSNARQRYRAETEPVGQLWLNVGARMGTDDNVYRTPSSPYVDLGQTGTPLVSPQPQSANYIPIDIRAEYVLNASDDATQFVFGYRLDGDFYDAPFSNANEITQRLSIGAEVDLQSRNARWLDSEFFIRNHRETNFDPDNGLDRDVNGTDISDRFSYTGAGLRSAYHHELGTWEWGFTMHAERRDYASIPLVTPYTHNYLFAHAWTDYNMSEKTTLRFGLKQYRRDYDQRRARDLNGDLLTSNAFLAYVYSSIDIGAEYRLSPRFAVELDLYRIDRDDGYEGYADYSMDGKDIFIRFRPNNRIRLSIGASARTYDYQNAFAFNIAAGGPMSLDSMDTELDFEYRFNSALSIWAEIVLYDVTSPDPRITYSRAQSMLGIRWRH